MNGADLELATGERRIICICPTCRKRHTLLLYWTGGNVTPRIRCKRCKKAVHIKDSSSLMLEKILRGVKFSDYEIEREIEQELV